MAEIAGFLLDLSHPSCFSCPQTQNADDLRLFAGETLEVLQKNDHGWWYGVANRSGTLHKGYFPKNYVKPVVIVPDAPKPPPRPARNMEPPAPEPVTKLAEAVATKVVLERGPSFSLKTCTAFDDLMELGYAVEVDDAGKAAKGELIQKGKRVELHCNAKIWDGASTVTKVFADGAVSFVIGDNQVTAGLDAAMLKLRVGDKATITCSPSMAYGAAGNPPSVPPNSFVVFTVEVLSASTATTATTSSSSSAGTQMLLGSGIANTRKVKGTENRRDSRIILVGGASASASMSTSAAGSNGNSSGTSSAAITPLKPAKPTPVGELHTMRARLIDDDLVVCSLRTARVGLPNGNRANFLYFTSHDRQ